MDFGENPFSLQPVATKKASRKAVVSAIKVIVVIAACLGATLFLATQSRRWLALRLTHDFDSLSSTEQRSRLIQIADLGEWGISPLVQQMANQEFEVARTSYDLLRSSQSQWSILGRNEQQNRHATMIAAIESIAIHLPDDRTGWATSLLQHTLLTTIERKDLDAGELYRSASHVIEMLSLSDRSGPSILDAEPLDPKAPRRLVITAKPLPVFSSESIDPLTSWPPTPSQETSAVAIVSGPANIAEESVASPTESASIYRSGASPLQLIQPEEVLDLRDIRQSQETSFQTNDIQSTSLQSATHLVDSPMQTFDDKSVMHWLGSPHHALRDKARLELVSRGFDGTQIAIATQIASGDVQTKVQLVDALARSADIDPRPWLLMMLEDASREVRLKTVSVLATMNDPSINRQLRIHLVDERDPTVAFRIRRNLNIR